MQRVWQGRAKNQHHETYRSKSYIEHMHSLQPLWKDIQEQKFSLQPRVPDAQGPKFVIYLCKQTKVFFKSE